MPKLTHPLLKLCLHLAIYSGFIFLQVNQANAQFDIQGRYTKIERMIPMRDGVHLFTAIYIPKDNTELHPILMERTPYSCNPYGETLFPFSLSRNRSFIDENYIFVFQDVRGRYMSEGKFKEVTPFIVNKKYVSDVDESSDTYDTVDWLLKNIEGNNGNVGLYGISYQGFYATASLPNAHPAIKAVSPQAPVTDEFEGDDAYHRGAFFLLDNVEFLNGFDYPRQTPWKSYPLIDNSFKFKDAYEYYIKLGPIKNINTNVLKNQSVIWNEYIEHDSKDAYWQARNIRPQLKKIRPAVLVVGGWFDAEDMFGSLKTYEAIERLNNNNNSHLIMGPWTHGSWSRHTSEKYATYEFGQNTASFFKDKETSFFNFYLKGKGNLDLSEANIFFTGSNVWKSFDEWPVKDFKPYDLYLNSGKKLSIFPEKSRSGFEDYVSDPYNPVPYTSTKSGDRDDDYLGADQRFSATRPDVLTFVTDTLKDDVTLAGPIIARLFVSMTGTDADFIVKLIDVLPDTPAVQQLVRAEVIRGKFRNNFSQPQAFEPGKTTPVKLTLNDVAHTFKTGHRIMVHIQSSWFPLVDRNPQKFMRIPQANEADFEKATIRIERNARYMSTIQCRRIRL